MVRLRNTCKGFKDMHWPYDNYCEKPSHFIASV